MIKKIWNKIFGKPKEPISFKQGFDLTEIPVVTFRQGDTKLNFLLDTGSNLNIIDKNILETIQYKMLNTQTDVMGLEGIKKTGKECIVQISHRSLQYECPFTISDLSTPFSLIKKESGVTLHGIIGSLFFNEYKYVLDFDELIAYSKA